MSKKRSRGDIAPRAAQVLALIRSGIATRPQICAAMKISPGTAGVYLAQLRSSGLAFANCSGRYAIWRLSSEGATRRRERRPIVRLDDEPTQRILTTWAPMTPPGPRSVWELGAMT